MAEKNNVLLVLINNESIEEFKPLTVDINTRVLKDINYVFAGDGARATKMLENQKFDLIIIDLSAPRIFDGKQNNIIVKHENATHIPGLLIRSTEVSDAQSTARGYTTLNADVLLKDIADNIINFYLKPKTKAAPTIVAATENKNKSVDVRVVNAVIKATLKICDHFGINNASIQKAELKEVNGPIQGTIASSIPIQSKVFNGQLIISFEEDIYLKMVSSMFGEEQKTINVENEEAIGEIANIIFGNSKPDFTQYGVAMTQPKVLPRNPSVNAPAGSVRITVPFSNESGKFFIDIISFS